MKKELKFKLDIQLFAVANENAVKYHDLTDEIITDIKKMIELFVESEEYWDKFVHHSSVKRGAKTFSSRRLVKPIVKESDIAPRAEFVAPRPTKIVVETFEKTIENYGDKAIYSREDMQYHYDDTVKNITDVLKEIAIQKLDFIKGAAFLASRAAITYDTSMLNTLSKGAIILRKNGAKRWANGKYLAHITPEEKKLLIAELEAKGSSLSEKVKVEINGVPEEFPAYGDFMFSETISPIMYKSDSVQHMILMGKRGIDGNSPIDVSKLEGESGIELIRNGLGTGVLVDVDGNYTSDDNKQQGSVAINMEGLGATVSDDLCILDCEVSVAEIKATALLESEKTGFVSISGAEVELDLTAGSGTEFEVVGARYDSTGSKYYGNASTIVSVQVKASATKTLGDVTAADWSATYKLASGGADKDAEIVAVVKTTAANDTLLVRVPVNCYGALAIECEATAS